MLFQPKPVSQIMETDQESVENSATTAQELNPDDKSKSKAGDDDSKLRADDDESKSKPQDDHSPDSSDKNKASNHGNKEDENRSDTGSKHEHSKLKSQTSPGSVPDDHSSVMPITPPLISVTKQPSQTSPSSIPHDVTSTMPITPPLSMGDSSEVGDSSSLHSSSASTSGSDDSKDERRSSTSSLASSSMPSTSSGGGVLDANITSYIMQMSLVALRAMIVFCKELPVFPDLSMECQAALIKGKTLYGLASKMCKAKGKNK